MMVRVTKECLIAAAELNLINGDYVFIAFELDMPGAQTRQKAPFKWATADHGEFYIDGSLLMLRIFFFTLIMIKIVLFNSDYRYIVR